MDGEVADRLIRLDDGGAVDGGAGDVEREPLVEGGHLAVLEIGAGDGPVDDVVGEDVAEGLKAEHLLLGELKILAHLGESGVGRGEHGQGLVAGERLDELRLLHRRGEDGEVVAQERRAGHHAGGRGDGVATDGAAAGADAGDRQGRDAGSGGHHRVGDARGRGARGVARSDPHPGGSHPG